VSDQLLTCHMLLATDMHLATSSMPMATRLRCPPDSLRDAEEPTTCSALRSAHNNNNNKLQQMSVYACAYNTPSYGC
jgi:hypothetical protein